MNLNINDWKCFYLKYLYDIQMGNGFDKNKLDEDTPEVNLVSRVSYNNGVDVRVGFVNGIKPFEAGLVTVALGGSYLGSCFVQEEPFYTGQNVAVMKAKHKEITKFVSLFITGLVRYESKIKYYAFGRELNTHIRTDFDIKLPVKHNPDGSFFIDNTHTFSDEGFVPDWQFMEDYIKSLHYKPLTTNNPKGCLTDLQFCDWKEFRLSDIFPKKKVNHFSSVPESEGNIPFISSASTNNGVVAYVDELAIDGNCITVSTNGDCFDCFYQPSYVAISNDVEALYNLNLNPYSAIFIITIMTMEKPKWSYGRKPKNDKVYDSIIKLPATPTGEPDWQFMEDYIKSLPYGDRLEG